MPFKVNAKNTKKLLTRFIFSLLQYLMSFLCEIMITGCKELTTFSSYNSLLFRPATIIANEATELRSEVASAAEL